MLSNLWDVYNCEVPEYIQYGMQSDALLRLRYVGMNCGMNYTSFPFYCDMEAYSRFEHSVGVALIIHHFTEDSKQALSGLFHDLSTPAFAHVIDFLNHDHINQESTELGTYEIIQSDSGIQNLLKKYRISENDVCDYHRYPIADNDTPRLSADRLEYTLGCLWHYHFCTKTEIESFYNDLTVSLNEENMPELCFQHLSIAEAFAMKALKCSYVFVADEDRYGMEILADLLRRAIDCDVLEADNLMKDEPFVIEKLKASSMMEEWNAFTKLERISVSQEYVKGSICVKAKKRYIDPFIVELGRLSGVSSNFAEEKDKFLNKNFDVYMIKENTL